MENKRKYWAIADTHFNHKNMLTSTTKLTSKSLAAHLINFFAFVYASIYLGEFHGFYDLFYWWDMLLHGWAGVTLCLFLFDFLCREDSQGDPHRINPLYALGLTASLLTSWEIFEFLMDSNFDLNMQKDGIKDTMEDIIFGKVTAVVTTLWIIFKSDYDERFYYA
jgi:hypothetical protein